MHVELPRQPLSTFRDFAKHYLMMVLSILTALGLEAWIEHSHHAHAAQLSRRRMDEELQGVLQDMRQAEAMDSKSLANLKSLDAMIIADLAAGTDAAQINRHILSRKADFTLNTSWPSLPTNAWDVAVADQSIGWIDSSALQRYSAAYTSVRTLSNWLLHDSTLVIDTPRLVDTAIDLQLDHPVEPYAFLRSIRQMELMLATTITVMQNAAEQIAPAVGSAVEGSQPASGSAPAETGG